MVVADEQVAVVVIEVEAGALTVTPHLAVLTLVFPSPASVTHHLEAVLPHIPEVVLVDITLVHIAAHRGAAADSAITTNRGYLNTAAAIEEMVADLLFIMTEKSLAGIADVNDCLIA